MKYYSLLILGSIFIIFQFTLPHTWALWKLSAGVSAISIGGFIALNMLTKIEDINKLKQKEELK